MSGMAYREYPALVIDVSRGIETCAPVMWGNAEGMDVSDFTEVLDTTVQELIAEMHETRFEGTSPQQVIVRAYAMRIPQWVTPGYEKDFILDVYPDPRSRQRNRDFSTPMYGYQFEVWEVWK